MYEYFIKKVHITLFVLVSFFSPIDACNEMSLLMANDERERNYHLAIHEKQKNSIENTLIMVNDIWDSHLFEAMAWLRDAKDMRQNIKENAHNLGIVSVSILKELEELEEDCKKRLADLGTISFKYRFSSREQVLYLKQLATTFPPITVTSNEDDKQDVRTIIKHNLTVLQLKSLIAADDLRNQRCSALHTVLRDTLSPLKGQVAKELQHSAKLYLRYAIIENDNSIGQMQAKSFAVTLKRLKDNHKEHTNLIMGMIENVCKINGERNDYLNQEEIKKLTENYYSLLPPPSTQPYSSFNFLCKPSIIITVGVIFFIPIYLYWGC